MNNSNNERRLVTRQAIQAKINTLRSFLASDPPAGVFVPKSIRQFRDWSDPVIGLQKIGSPGTLNLRQSPHNCDLIEEINLLIAELARTRLKPRKKASPLQDQLEKVRTELEQQRALTAGLVSQLHETRHTLKQAEANEAAAKYAKTQADETISSLRKTLTQTNQRTFRVVGK